MTPPAPLLLSAALILGVIGLGVIWYLWQCYRSQEHRAIVAEEDRRRMKVELDRACRMPTFGPLQAATAYELGAEVARRMPDTAGKVVVSRDGDDVFVMAFGLDTGATADLLALAFEKVEGEAA